MIADRKRVGGDHVQTPDPVWWRSAWKGQTHRPTTTISCPGLCWASVPIELVKQLFGRNYITMKNDQSIGLWKWLWENNVFACVSSPWKSWDLVLHWSRGHGQRLVFGIDQFYTFLFEFVISYGINTNTKLKRITVCYIVKTDIFLLHDMTFVFASQVNQQRITKEKCK